jgi:hypothetical protein
MSHKVRTHRWKNGVLQTIDHFFEDLEQAMSFFGMVDAHTVKVYDDSNELVQVKVASGIPEQISSRYSYSGYDEDYSGIDDDTAYA